MTPIRYLKGDATNPQATGPKIICNILSDRVGWGKGFVLAISKRWKEPEQEFHKWFENRKENDFALGAVQWVQVQDDLWIVNMVGQHNLRPSKEGPPIRYEAVDQCLKQVGEKAKELGASVHMPRIGCGLAGGKWEKIEPLIEKNLCTVGVEVTVYDFG